VDGKHWVYSNKKQCRYCLPVQAALNPSQTITDTEEQFQKSVGVRDE
jgi:hypothetical protein